MALDAFLRLSVPAILPPDRGLRIDPATTGNPKRPTTPTVVARHGDYTLLGCYGGPRSGTELEVFEEGGYITLIPVPRDKSTVSSCIEGCAASVPSGTSDESYPHAAVSEGRCLCGLSLSKRISPINRRLCDTPCDGDPDVSCGGSDYALVYSYNGCPDLETTDQAINGAGLSNPNEGRRRCPRNTDTMDIVDRPSTANLSSVTRIAGSSTSTFATGDSAPPSPTIPTPREDTPDDQLPQGTGQAVLRLVDTKSTVAVVIASVTCAVVLATLALLLCILHRRRRRPPESNPRGCSDSSPSRRETSLERDARDEKALEASRAYIAKGPTPRLDTSAVHWHSHTSAPTSGSDSRRQSHGVQEGDSSAAGDTEPSGTASPTILSVSHMVVRPVAGGVLIVDTSGPNRRYSMPVSATRGGLSRPSARG